MTTLLAGYGRARRSKPDLADAVAALGFDVVELHAAADRRGRERRALTVRDGRRFDVVVPRGVAPAADAVRRLYHWLRLRGIARRHDVRTARGALEREVLLAHALRAARVRTPALAAVGRARDGAGLLAFEHLDGRPTEAVAEALPMAHPVVLTRATRAAHRSRRWSRRARSAASL
jgi:hypothetical protein